MAKKTALVVDDEKEILEIVGQTLRRDGWQVFEADNARAAWELWESLGTKPEIALFDLNIAEPKDGLELARKVKGAVPETKVIILSGYFTDAERYPHEFYYIDKPFKLSELLVLCNGLLKLEE